MIQVIPAIDLIGGCCVRLTEGRYDTEKVFSEDPVAMAKKFEQQGARRLHVVDLEAARSGTPSNWKVAAKIANSISIPVELGGGIRSLESIQSVLDAGIEWAILGTIACKNPFFVEEATHRWGEHIIVGLDAREGKVATDGWTEMLTDSAEDLAVRFEKMGIGGIIYTDIARDGRLAGPNLRAIADLAQEVAVPIIASGGISTIDDLTALQSLGQPNIIGAITGKALYEGRFRLDEAIQALNNEVQ
jgi:phosphoribosylformimino-5-aminoimidazole carboxamide ribotide isomerase